jgi:hypothetical protein
MANAKTLNHNFATIGNGALLIWWGIVIMFDPLTIGMGAIGAGLILLGLNICAAEWHSHQKIDNRLGKYALWGILDTIFTPSFELSFALMLIVIGLVRIGSLLTHSRAE